MLSKMPLLLLKPNCQRSFAYRRDKPGGSLYPVTIYRALLAQTFVRLPPDGRFTNGQRPTRQVSIPPGSGCLTSLWPLAVASADEIKLLRQNRNLYRLHLPVSNAGKIDSTCPAIRDKG